MARRKGVTLYGNKAAGRGVQGSYYITRVADGMLRKAAKRGGVSVSDAIEFCVRASSALLTKDVARDVVEGQS